MSCSGCSGQPVADVVAVEGSCECESPGFCQRHQCWKTPHLHNLCRTRPDYFALWEAGRGPCLDAAPPPGVLQQAVNVGKAIVAFVGNGAKRAPRAVIRERLAICRACDQLDGTRCKACTCFVALKVQSPTEACPAPFNKWPAV